MNSKLIPLVVSASNFKTENRTGVPTWWGTIDDRTTWYTDNLAIGNDGVSYFINTVEQEDETQIYIQYGKDEIGWAGATFFRQDVSIIGETLDESTNILTVEVRVKPMLFSKRESSHYGTGVPVEYTVSVNDEEIYNFSGTTRSEFDNTQADDMIFTVQVEPETTSSLTAYTLNISYPQGNYSDTQLVAGAGVENPLLTMYIPMAIRKSGVLKSLNTNNGFIRRRINNVWQDFSKENRLTIHNINTGKNRIRASGGWRQAPPMV